MIANAIKQKLCVALDVDTLAEAKDLVEMLSPWVGVFKVGSQLFTSEGPRVVEAIQNAGGEVFLDLKYHDIPNTVMQASLVAAKMGVYMFNVHALGGYYMMHQVASKLKEEAERSNHRKPIILGVTILTSMTPDELYTDLKIVEPLDQYVTHLARLAQLAGLDGIVCSPQELANARQACGPEFTLVTPGVRPSWAAVNDQKRIMTPREAVLNGADYLVIGRPILEADNPEQAAERILLEISQG